MKPLLPLLISLTIVSNSLYAGDAVFLEKDKAAPFDGVLLPQDKALAIKQMTLEHDTYLLMNQSLEKSLSLQKNIIQSQDDKVNILLQQNDKLAKSLGDERSMSNWERIGFFALGAVLTTAIAYGASKAAR